MAVYTEVSEDDLTTLLAEYDIGDVVACKGIAEGVENSNFLLQTTMGTYILTLYEKRVNPADLPFFLDVMEHLAAKGIACPLPVHGKDGAALRTCAGRPCAIITFLPGLWPRRITAEHCGELGTMVARMHLAVADFDQQRENTLSVKGWQGLFDENRDGADAIRAGLADDLQGELDHLAANWPSDLPGGVVHADLFPDNVFFQGDKCSGVIDYYFACSDSYAYDLAICLNAWCFEQSREFNTTKARRLLKAYETVRPLSAQEKAAFPLLARGAAMRFLLTRLHDWSRTPEGAQVTPKDPMAYYERLRFHRGVSDLTGYGVD